MNMHTTIDLRLTADGVYRSAHPMTADQISRAAPAAFASGAHDSRSDRYTPIPTMTVVEALRRAVGVEVYGATQAGARDADRRAHTKHVLRLRRPDQAANGDTPELVLTNSYDGSTSYRLNLGCYRFVCANGLMVGDTWDEARVKHMGEDAIPAMIEQTQRLAARFDDVRDAVADLKRVQLEPEAQIAFARSAALLRHDSDAETVEPRDLLRVRREADKSADLWTTFNRVQERLIRGEYYKTARDKYDRPTLRRVRPVKGVDQNSAINRALWTLTEEMAKLSK